jgi:outer membrane protein OmpA-like peptidoglycan-associated protein
MNLQAITRIGVTATLILGTAALGCRSREEPRDPPTLTGAPAPVQPAPPAPPPPADPAAQLEAADPDLAVVSVTAVAVDTKLAAQCGMGSSSVYFRYDASELRDDAKERLDKLVECVREGAAKGRKLEVVGHTDPVGSKDYNEQLGMTRAESVAKYLKDEGVKDARVTTASKGQQLADASDPLRWPEDRRVTVRLAE